MEDGLILVPGTTVEKVVGAFECAFGHARCQNYQMIQGYHCLTAHRNFQQRMQVLTGHGVFVHWLGTPGPYVHDQRAISMHELTTPTLAALAHLRKMIGCMKAVGDVGLHLEYPQPG